MLSSKDRGGAGAFPGGEGPLFPVCGEGGGGCNEDDDDGCGGDGGCGGCGGGGDGVSDGDVSGGGGG